MVERDYEYSQGKSYRPPSQDYKSNLKFYEFLQYLNGIIVPLLLDNLIQVNLINAVMIRIIFLYYLVSILGCKISDFIERIKVRNLDCFRIL